MINKKVAIIGTVGIPSKYGGFETLVEHLTKELSQKYYFTVYCSSKSYENKLDSYNGAKLKYIPLKANGIQSIPYDVISILSALRNSDTILILGVSGCVLLPAIRLFSKKRLIVNIDGLEWKRDKWNKWAKWFLKLSEKIAVRYSDIVISDNKIIQEYVSEEYGVKSELIAYGADHVNKEVMSDMLLKKYPFLNEKYALKVCRIEPENNIHLILEAFEKFKQFNLIIIGNWDNSNYGRSLKVKYGEKKHIYLLDPIYDQNKLNQIRSNCYVYLHGHSAGGTNPSLVEAMYLGLPVFTYGIEYNKETTQHEAKYFHNKDELMHIMENTTDIELQDLALKNKMIAMKHYTWGKIAAQYADLL